MSRKQLSRNATPRCNRRRPRLIESNLELSYCEARAPVDGGITKRNVQVGSYVSVGTLMFLIVSPNLWMTAKLRWNLSFYSFAAYGF